MMKEIEILGLSCCLSGACWIGLMMACQRVRVREQATSLFAQDSCRVDVRG